MTLADLYLQLLRAYGPQGWWPLHLSGAGYHPQHFELPQTDLERLEIALGAVLTQNTAWNNVEKALTGLKEAGFFGRFNPYQKKNADVKIIGNDSEAMGDLKGEMKATAEKFCEKNAKNGKLGMILGKDLLEKTGFNK